MTFSTGLTKCHSKKWPLYCPQGSGTLRQQLSMMHAGLHKLWYPSNRDTSTWSKLGAHGEHGEHGDVFLFSNLGALRELNQIFIACLFKGSQDQFFPLLTLLFTAFLVTVLKILTYALVSTWSSVSSGYEHVKQKMHPCMADIQMLKLDNLERSRWTRKSGQSHILRCICVNMDLMVLYRYIIG